MPSVQVTDSDDKPIEKATIYVKWSGGGSSHATTNSQGLADLNCSGGTIEEIHVNSKKVLGRRRVESDEIIEVHGSRY